MFKIYLTQHQPHTTSHSTTTTATSPQENRRSQPRYQLKSKNLQLANEADILNVIDVSEQGLCTLVGDRGFKRFQKNDIYTAKMRFEDKVYSLHIKVSWKKSPHVGFAIIDASEQTWLILKALIRPYKIAACLEETAHELQHDSEYIVLQAPEAIKLCLWFHDDEIQAWQFDDGIKRIKWQLGSPVQTGSIEALSQSTTQAQTTAFTPDPEPCLGELELFKTMLEATHLAYKPQIIKTLEDDYGTTYP